jgi:hypothetical protein
LENDVPTFFSRCVRVRLLVPIAGGLSARPFVPDTSDRGRFPPQIRLEASLLGLPVGRLDLSGEDGVGRIVHLSVRRAWPHEPAASRLLDEVESVARLAGWKLVVWDPAPEQKSTLTWAEEHGFSAVDDGLLQKPLPQAAPPKSQA